MADPVQLAILKQGSVAWNQWRQQNPSIGVNFIWENLSNLDLCGVNLRGALLARVQFRDSALRGADLRGTDLSGTHFINADLRGADLAGAILFATTFATTWLNGTKGLESCIHKAPCSIGIDTIFQSNGEIPEIFLRGCGVPEPFIVQMNALIGTMSPLQFYSCFISYSTEDQPFANRLYADLQNNGVRCWYAPHHIQGGPKIHEQIDEAIRVYDRLLLILTSHSMNSEWVRTEIAKARKRELRENRRMLFPVRLVDFETLRDWECFDADTGKDSAREIREYFIPDFSDWKKHDDYKQAFDRLLRDLTAKDDAPAKSA